MVIAKYTENLYASEVYRELERQAVRKGHFKPTEEQQIKLAAVQVEQKRRINRPIDASPSDDLVQDIARLAFAMRRKGFISQAEDLEQKLVVYKQAETDMYKVTPGNDFAPFENPEGEFSVADGELGVVETLDSAAKKIRSITEKEPTGKLSSLVKELGLTKEASSPLYDVTSEKNKDFFEFAHRDGDVEIIEGSGELGKIETIESLAKKIREMVGRNPTGKAPSKNASLEAFAGYIKTAVEPEFKGVYDGINNKIRQLPNIQGLALGKVMARTRFSGNPEMLKLYAALSGIPEDTVRKAVQVTEMATSLGFTKFNSQEFVNFVKGGDFTKITALANALGVDASPINSVGQYRVPDGSVFNSVAALTQRYPGWDFSRIPQNSNPLGLIGIDLKRSVAQVLLSADKTAYEDFRYIVPENAQAYGEQLSRAFSSVATPVWGANWEIVRGIHERVNTVPDNFVKAISNAAVAAPDTLVNDITGVLDMDKGLAPIYTSKDKVQKAYDGLGKETLLILKGMGRQAEAAALEKWYAEINVVFANAQKSLLEKGGESTVDVTPAIDKMNTAINLWRSAAKKAPRDQKVQTNVSTNIKSVMDLRNVIRNVGLSDSNSKPKNRLRAVLTGEGYKNFDELLKDLDQVVAQARADAK